MKRGIMAGFFTLLMLLCGCGGSKTNSAEAAAVAYIQALGEGNIEKVRSMETKDTQDNDLYTAFSKGLLKGLASPDSDPSDFEEIAALIFKEAFTDCKVTGSAIQEDTAYVEVNVTGIPILDEEAIAEVNSSAVRNDFLNAIADENEEELEFIADSDLSESEVYYAVSRIIVNHILSNKEAFASVFITALAPTDTSIIFKLIKEDGVWKVDGAVTSSETE